MKPTVETIALKDYDSAIIALFGSYEKYRTSPIFIECCNRIDYLKLAKVKVAERLQQDKENIKWWDVWNKIITSIGINLSGKTFNKEIDDLIHQYEKYRALPMPFFVRMTNEEFDKTYKTWKKVLQASGVEEFKNE